MQFELWARRGRDGAPEYHLLAPADARYAAERARLGAGAELLGAFEAEDHGEALATSDDLIRRSVAHGPDHGSEHEDVDTDNGGDRTI